MTVNERLENLREVMRREHLAAFIFPSTDPHQGEYIPDHWKGREFISGFNGSAGTAVVTMTAAALWTDSRYFLAAADQLKGTEYQLMKLKIEGTPTIPEWIGRGCGAGAEVGGAGAGYERRRFQNRGGTCTTYVGTCTAHHWNLHRPPPFTLGLAPPGYCNGIPAEQMASQQQLNDVPPATRRRSASCTWHLTTV